MSHDGWKILGDHKMVSPDRKTFIKVIDFPVPEDCPYAGESMWVVTTEGTDNDGIGRLDNIPAFCTEVSAGDFIEYGGGTEHKKPQFIRRVDEYNDDS